MINEAQTGPAGRPGQAAQVVVAEKAEQELGPIDVRVNVAFTSPKPAQPVPPIYPPGVAAHGSFDDQAKSRSPQLWASPHHGVLGGALLGRAGVAAAATALGGRPRR